MKFRVVTFVLLQSMLLVFFTYSNENDNSLEILSKDEKKQIITKIKSYPDIPSIPKSPQQIIKDNIKNNTKKKNDDLSANLSK